MTSFVKSHPELYNSPTVDTRLRQRDPTLLAKPTTLSTLCAKNCYEMSIKIYNHLPKEIRDLKLNNYKYKLCEWLLDKCFYSINEFFDFDTF